MSTWIQLPTPQEGEVDLSTSEARLLGEAIRLSISVPTDRDKVYWKLEAWYTASKAFKGFDPLRLSSFQKEFELLLKEYNK